MSSTFDFAVIGSGVFGAWTAKRLRQSGVSVVLIDAYGPGNSRSSSGGETRIIRSGYGRDELYTRWALHSLPQWLELFDRVDRVGRSLFHRTGVLWLSDGYDPHVQGTWELLQQLQVKCEKLSGEEIARRYPQLRFEGATLGVLEPESGVLMARQAVQALAEDLAKSGVERQTAAILPPSRRARLIAVETHDGRAISAGTYVFACGPWLPKLFPELLKGRILPTRQEVFFFGTPAGSEHFDAPNMPAWLHHTHPDRPYALPNIENRGLKIALDTHGPTFDPDSDTRVISQSAVDQVRAYLKQHVPSLSEAPVVESRVCQYENTWNGDFLIDRHPDMDNVWLVGGGSGHGFKHGPAVGKYLSERILNNAPPEQRFSLVGKLREKAREVY